MTPILSILVCHLPERYDFMKRLSEILDPQLQKHKNNVVCLSDDSRYKTIGRKRNDLLARVNSKYLCWIDDDDLVCPNYVDLIMEGVHKDVDTCSLTGIITEDGQNPKKFVHSIRYDSWFEKDSIYYRNTNHLNVVKTSIAKQMCFPEKNHGEDKSYSDQLLASGLLKTEHWIEPILYYYEYRSRK